MKVIEPSFEILPSVNRDYSNVYPLIEKIGRVCYKSEDKITPDSAIPFIKRLVKRQHFAMIEHANLIFLVDQSTFDYFVEKSHQYRLNTGKLCYLYFTEEDEEKGTRSIISGNLRAWYDLICASEVSDEGEVTLHDLETFIVEKFKEIFQPSVKLSFANSKISLINEPDKAVVKVEDSESKDHSEIEDTPEFTLVIEKGKFVPLIIDDLSNQEKLTHATLNVLFTCNRGVTHELVRMRPCSFAQESTRYANYSLDKYGNEITVIRPYYFPEGSEAYEAWYNACKYAEDSYMKLRNMGYIPEMARGVLPTDLKAEITMTGNYGEWRHIFKLRACDSTGPAHPQMGQSIRPVLREMQKREPEIFGDLVIPERPDCPF